MSKKIIKTIIIVAGVLAALAGILYLAKTLKDKASLKNAPAEEGKEPEEEAINAREAFDFSDLKFSRNYVDLR